MADNIGTTTTIHADDSAVGTFYDYTNSTGFNALFGTLYPNKIIPISKALDEISYAALAGTGPASTTQAGVVTLASQIDMDLVDVNGSADSLLDVVTVSSLQYWVNNVAPATINANGFVKLASTGEMTRYSSSGDVVTVAQLNNFFNSSSNAATVTQYGAIKLASTTEALEGTNNANAVTPVGVKAYVDNAVAGANNIQATETLLGNVKLATNSDSIAGVNNLKSVTPYTNLLAFNSWINDWWNTNEPTPFDDSQLATIVYADNLVSAGNIATLSSANNYTSIEINTLSNAMISADAITLSSANNYTDTKIRETYKADSAKYATKLYSDNGDASILSQSMSYTDTKVLDITINAYGETLTNSKAYTDSVATTITSGYVNGDKSTLSSAKAYTDSALASFDLPDFSLYSTIAYVDAVVATQAQVASTYTDTQITLIDFSSYATIDYSDTQDQTILSSAEAYSDFKLTESKSYTDSKIDAIPTSYDYSKQIVPIGGIVMMAWGDQLNAAIASQHWVICDGLNGAPDLRGKFVVGFDSSDSDFNSLGEKGGSKTTEHTHAANVVDHRLTWREIPPHKHNTNWGMNRNQSAPDGVEFLKGRNNNGSSATDFDNYNYLTSNRIIDPNSKTGYSYNDTAESHGHGFVMNSTTQETLPPYYTVVYVMRKK